MSLRCFCSFNNLAKKQKLSIHEDVYAYFAHATREKAKCQKITKSLLRLVLITSMVPGQGMDPLIQIPSTYRPTIYTPIVITP